MKDIITILQKLNYTLAKIIAQEETNSSQLYLTIFMLSSQYPFPFA